MKQLLSLLFALGMFAGTGVASAIDVEVKFSPRIEKSLVAIDATEQRRASHFRSLNGNGTGIEDITFENLVLAAAEGGLSQLGHGYDDHKLLIEIDSFSIPSYSLAKFRGMRTRMKGRFSLIDANGVVVASEEVKTLILSGRSTGISRQTTVTFRQSNLEDSRETFSNLNPALNPQRGAGFVAADSNPGGFQVQHFGPPLRVLLSRFVETGFETLADSSS